MHGVIILLMSLIVSRKVVSALVQNCRIPLLLSSKTSPQRLTATMPTRKTEHANKEDNGTSSTPNIWLMKNEPEEYSLDHLQRDVVGVWDGIRNYQARNFMRSMQIGDRAYFYYSSCKQPGIYGVMRIAGPSFPDPKALDRTSDYYDARAASTGKNPWDAISVRMECRYNNPLYLPRIRELPLGECRLTAKGNRLSMFPITSAQAEIIDNELASLNSAANDIIYGDLTAVPAPSTHSTTSPATIQVNQEKKGKRKVEETAAVEYDAPEQKKTKKEAKLSTITASTKQTKKASKVDGPKDIPEVEPKNAKKATKEVKSVGEDVAVANAETKKTRGKVSASLKRK